MFLKIYNFTNSSVDKFSVGLDGVHGNTTLKTEAPVNFSSVIGAKLCARHLLEVKVIGIRRAGGVADKETCTVYTTNNTSQRQYFVARPHFLCRHCLWFTQFLRFFPCYPQASDVGKTLRFAPTTVLAMPDCAPEQSAKK